jgi:hypothetical protein
VTTPTDAYIEECLTPGSRLRSVMDEAPVPPTIIDMFGKRLLDRPLFIAEAEIRAAAADATDLFGVLVSLPDRLFGGDLGAYCERIGLDARRSAYLRRLGGGTPPMHGRADLYHDGTSLKMLEFNIGSPMGGTDRCEISRALLEVPAFAEFAAEHGLGYVHTGERVAAILREVAAPVTGGRDPVVALIEADGGLPAFFQHILANQAMMRRQGIDFRYGEVGQLATRGDKLVLDGTPIDVVLRYFDVNQLCETPDSEAVMEPIFRAHEAGTAVIFTPLESELFGNKGALAMLSDPAYSHAFTEEEKALVDRFLPWTRPVEDTTTIVDGQETGLLAYCRDNQADLILKPMGDYGGHGSYVGWQTSPKDWEEALAGVVSRGYIVQRRVVGRREKVVERNSGVLEDWLAVWDVFLTPHGYAGSHIRAVPWDDSGLVGMTSTARSRTTGIFYY